MNSPLLVLLFFVLRLTLAFYVFLEEHVFTIVNSIGELADPVAKNHHAGLMAGAFDRTGQLDVKLYMAMTKDEIVDIGMLSDIFLGEEYQRFIILA